MKYFDEWNDRKKKIDVIEKIVYFKQQEVWWCRTGLNVGIEANGKGLEFARPILIIKKHHKNSCLVIHLTTRNKNNKAYYEIDKDTHPGVFANLSQIKVIDTKRLISKMFFLKKENFDLVKREIIKFNFL
jgi:mRNA-degrading endonuclease toxin of MazEF toxin-antitoxin module